MAFDPNKSFDALVDRFCEGAPSLTEEENVTARMAVLFVCLAIRMLPSRTIDIILNKGTEITRKAAERAFAENASGKEN